MSEYHIYAIGNALVDKEFEVTDQFLEQSNIDKGVMTLVEKEYQEQILNQLKSTFGLKKRASGGSAANTIIAASYFGSNCFYSCKVGNDEPGEFYLHDLNLAGVKSNMSDHGEEGTTGRCVFRNCRAGAQQPRGRHQPALGNQRRRPRAALADRPGRVTQ